MKKFAIISLILILALADSTFSSLPDRTDNETIKLRTGRHRGFIRVVFEGGRELISKAKIKIRGKEISVNFGTPGFHLIKGRGVKIPVKKDGDQVIVSLKEGHKIKTFRLSNPARLVIDILKTHISNKRPSATERTNRTETASLETNKKGHIGDHPMKTQRQEIRVPDRYRKLWSLFKSGNAYGVLTVIPEYPPSGREELCFYHYLSGVAYIEAQEYLSAIEHLTLAYVFASDEVLKEESLIARARAHRMAGLLQEARADYIMFIKQFPGSPHIRSAHMDLANTLVDLELFEEAIEHYGLAGDSAEVLYNKANALQKIGKYREARELYKKAINMDSGYPVKSPETEYLIGENLRMVGETSKAKNWLSTIQFGPFKDRARLSLGLISLKEGDYKSAVNYFQMATMSRERTVKIRALLNLSLAYIGTGRLDDAIESLEKIRHRYIDSGYYRDAILVLAKLYRKEGKIDRAVALLKELVYTKYPPEDAFSELEKIVIIGLKGGGEDINFADLWREVGLWMIDQSREGLLLKVARRLRSEDRQFIDLCRWLIDNASTRIKTAAATELADYYIEIGDEEDAKRYISYAIGVGVPPDNTLRVLAKIFKSEGKWEEAISKIKEIREFKDEDFKLLGDMLYDMAASGAGSTEDGIALYRMALERGDWQPEVYVRIADILYMMGRDKEASGFIKIAYQKNPSDEWLIYRMARMRQGRAGDMYGRLQNGNDIVAKVARTKVLELRVRERVREVF